MENRREFFRVQLNRTPLEAKVSIRQIDKESVQTGRSIILLEDISAGGLRFLSNLTFPVEKEKSLVLGFETKVLSHDLNLLGELLWRKQVSERIWEYGVQFREEQNSLPEMINLLNMFALTIRKGDLDSSSICKDPHMLQWIVLREKAEKIGMERRSASKKDEYRRHRSW